MNKNWQRIARQMIQGLGVQRGELINVRDLSGNVDVLLESLLAIERAGATPFVQFLPSEYLERLLAETPSDYLANWSQHRREWMKKIDRVLVFAGAQPAFGDVNKEALEAWRQATHQLNVIEESRHLPFLLATIPTERGAQQLGLTYDVLEEILLPALGASKEELQHEIENALNAVRGCRTITIISGNDHALNMEHGDRMWLSDDGAIDEVDQKQGAIVSNLPAGSIYTTVLEEKTSGSLWLSRAGEATDVVLHFVEGRIVDIQAAAGVDDLIMEFDSHTGEPRRVSHIGIGLNPYLDHPIGWTIVDEHVYGHLFIALGENQYMGGKNESSLNIDYALAGATLQVDGQMVIAGGKVIT